MAKPTTTINIIEDIFKINSSIELNENEQEYLKNLEISVYDLISEVGEEGKPQIKEIILDDLLKYDYLNLIKYLGLEFEDSIKESLEKQLKDENFLKITNTEETGDFFNNYLKDTGINDLIQSLKGYERKAEGSKEVFFKRRGAKIPTQRIEALQNVLLSKFNKTEFLSEKDDNEQAHIINFIIEQVYEMLLEIPNDLCDTQKLVEILTMFAIKLTNAIGLSKDYRRELMETMGKSFQSKRQENNLQQPQMIMQ